MRKQKRSILFSLDAMIATIIAMTLIAGIYMHMSDISSPKYGNYDLMLLASDSLAALKVQDEIRFAVDNEADARIKDFMEQVMPKNTCSRLVIYNSHDIIFMEITKNACIYDEQSIKVRSPLIHEGEIYKGEMHTWYR